MNTIKVVQTPIFFLKSGRVMSSSSVIFFSSTTLKKYIYIYYDFSCNF